MDKLKEKLEKAIELKLDTVIDETKDEQGSTIDEIDTLYKLKIESEKLDQCNEQATAELAEKRKDRIVNTITQVGIAVGGWICYDIWHKRGLKFEEVGSVASQWTRNLMSKMLPKK